MSVHGRSSSWILLAVALSAPLPAAAQAGAGGGTGPGAPGAMRRPRARAFDPAKVTTVQGQILELQRVPVGRREGIHAIVATGSEKISVRLGPAFYVDAQPVKLAKGDQVEVKGERLEVGGQPVIVAQEVRRGGDVLALRDASGVPLWRGQGMRRP